MSSRDVIGEKNQERGTKEFSKTLDVLEQREEQDVNPKLIEGQDENLSGSRRNIWNVTTWRRLQALVGFESLDYGIEWLDRGKKISKPA